MKAKNPPCKTSALSQLAAHKVQVYLPFLRTPLRQACLSKDAARTSEYPKLSAQELEHLP
ncbi:MAG: hypothetical protein KC422_24360 [Trueperaceae bacterium]|nr:hypothetical protein [Trueperaceae bacterium]